MPCRASHLSSLKREHSESPSPLPSDDPLISVDASSLLLRTVRRRLPAILPSPLLHGCNCSRLCLLPRTTLQHISPPESSPFEKQIKHSFFSGFPLFCDRLFSPDFPLWGNTPPPIFLSKKSYQLSSSRTRQWCVTPPP